MRRLVLALALLLGAMGQGQSAWAQSGVGGGGQSNVGGGSSSSGAVGSATNPAGPVMGFYLTNACPSSNTGQCFFTAANTQEQNNCSWSAVATTVTCTLTMPGLNATVAANVVTYTQATTGSSGGRDSFGLWAVGDSVTVSGFTVADTFFNQTCTLTSVTALNITCALVHANASSTTNGTVTDVTGGPFVAGDVAKQAQGWFTCQPDLASASYGLPITTGAVVTIAGFTDKSHVTLSQNPANAVASNGCFVWGTPDDTGAAAVDASLSVSPQCPKLFLAAAYYLWASPHFFTQPYGCSISPGMVASNHANVTLPAGFEVEGRGVGPTSIYLASNFPNGDSCQHASGPPADGVKGCFAIPMLGKWSDFEITGGGNSQGVNFSGSPSLIALQIATLQNFLCTNVGAYNGITAGILYGSLTQMYQVNNAGCGTVGFGQVAGTSESVWYRVVSENSPTGLSANSGILTCFWCVFGLALNVSNSSVVLNSGSDIHMFDGFISSGFPSPTGNNNFGYKCTNAAGQLYAEGTLIDVSSGGGSNTNSALYNSVAGCKAKLVRVKLNAQSAGFAYGDTGGGTLDLDGSTTFSLPFSTGRVPGALIADGHSFTGACTGVATASSTLGMYGTGPNVTLTTCTSAAVGTGIPMTQARTLSVLQCDSTATTVSVACTVMVNGVASALTCTMTAATSCIDFTHTVAVAKGDLISERIVTGAAETGANIRMQFIWQN